MASPCLLKRIVCDLDEEDESSVTEAPCTATVANKDEECSSNSSAPPCHSIISIATSGSSDSDPDEDPLKIDSDHEREQKNTCNALPNKADSPPDPFFEHFVQHNVNIPDQSARPERKRALYFYNILPKPDEPQPPKVTRQTAPYSKPVVRLPRRLQRERDKSPDKTFDISSSASSSASSRSSNSLSSTVTSPRRSPRSLTMASCEVRVTRLEDDHLRHSKTTKRRGQTDNISGAGKVGLFEQESAPVVKLKKKQEVIDKVPRKSRYGRIVSKPRTYNENSDTSRSPKSMVKSGQSQSPAKSVRRALFDSKASGDSSDDGHEDSIRCPSPFRYNSSQDFSMSPISATDFDKENYLERYIRPGPLYPEITQRMLRKMMQALETPHGTKLMNKFHLTFKQEHLVRYEGTKWLDDPNIDFYLEMIRERNRTTPGLPSVYVFHCFFYRLFSKSGYDAIQDASVRDAIVNCDLVFFPVIIRDHWRLVVADFRDRSLKCYDSMFRVNDKSLQNIKEYLIRVFREYRDKQNSLPASSSSLDLSPPASDTENTDEAFSADGTLKGKILPEDYQFEDWTLDCVSSDEIPQQKNGSDCGIFLCQYAESLARNVSPPFDFNQRNMPYFRVRMAYESLCGSLLPAPLPVSAVTLPVCSNPALPPSSTSPPPSEGPD